MYSFLALPCRKSLMKCENDFQISALKTYYSSLCFIYINLPWYWNRGVWANIVDPDQTAPKEQSVQGLQLLLFHLQKMSKKWNPFFQICSTFSILLELVHVLLYLVYVGTSVNVYLNRWQLLIDRLVKLINFESNIREVLSRIGRNSQELTVYMTDS